MTKALIDGLDFYNSHPNSISLHLLDARPAQWTL